MITEQTGPLRERDAGDVVIKESDYWPITNSTGKTDQPEVTV